MDIGRIERLQTMGKMAIDDYDPRTLLTAKAEREGFERGILYILDLLEEEKNLELVKEGINSNSKIQKEIKDIINSTTSISLRNLIFETQEKRYNYVPETKKFKWCYKNKSGAGEGTVTYFIQFECPKIIGITIS